MNNNRLRSVLKKTARIPLRCRFKIHKETPKTIGKGQDYVSKVKTKNKSKRKTR